MPSTMTTARSREGCVLVPLKCAGSAQTLSRSRGETVDDPASGVRSMAIAHAVVHPRAPSLPEFERLGNDPVTAPVRWPRQLVARVAVARLGGGKASLEFVTTGDRLALRRCPRAEPRRA